MYKNFFKRVIDITLSLLAIILLAIPMGIIVIAIKLDSKGPVLFKQKRIGIYKKTFTILKFRTMKTETPHDAPTHELSDPKKWITKVGGFLRKTSLDELPQIFNIFAGHMSIIGPRPALYNQDDLISERDKYGANNVKPGLTGLAQVSGRDELEISVKARLDGEYAAKLNQGKFKGFAMDFKCFFMTILSVLKKDGVVEGGTAEIARGKKISESEDENNCSKEKTNSLVSIIVATYRREEKLVIALNSLAEQTHKEIEIVLVDDNADQEWNDKVAKLVFGFKSNYPSVNFKYIVNEINLGSAKTRNKGIENCSGEYVTFLDDDDVYLPRKIENQVKFMQKNGLDYSVTDLNLYYENGKLAEKKNRTYIKNTDSKSLFEYHLMHNITGTDTMMFKKDYLIKIGGFAPIDVGDEFYLMQRAIENQGKFGYLHECDVRALVHTSDQGVSSGEGKIKGENQLYQHKKKYFNNLSRKSRRYVRMRHFAVLAFAEKRRGKKLSFIKYAIASVLSAPIACIKLLKGRS